VIQLLHASKWCWWDPRSEFEARLCKRSFFRNTTLGEKLYICNYIFKYKFCCRWHSQMWTYFSHTPEEGSKNFTTNLLQKNPEKFKTKFVEKDARILSRRFWFRLWRFVWGKRLLTDIKRASDETKLERRRETPFSHQHKLHHIKQWHCIDLQTPWPQHLGFRV